MHREDRKSMVKSRTNSSNKNRELSRSSFSIAHAQVMPNDSKWTGLASTFLVVNANKPNMVPFISKAVTTSAPTDPSEVQREISCSRTEKLCDVGVERMLICIASASTECSPVTVALPLAFKLDDSCPGNQLPKSGNGASDFDLVVPHGKLSAFPRL